MLPIEATRSNKILMMTTRKHGHYVAAQRLGWAALAYHKQKGAAPDPGLHKDMYGLHNDGKPDERLGVKVGTWSVGSISGRGTKICEEMRKRRVDVCCLQEVRWIGKGAQFMGVKGRKFKLW